MTQTAWYARWFGEEYLQVYPHRDQGEARRGVGLVLKHVTLEHGDGVLDLACGAGRHLREFRRQGITSVGLDLSSSLLQRARKSALPVVRGDMRDLPFANGAMALVTSFFTSFGYFSDRADDVRVVREVRRVLRVGGSFAFDLLNAKRVRRDLRPRDEREVNGVRVVQTRSLIDDGEIVEKRIEIHDAADSLPRVFYERVRLYETEDLEAMLSAAGLVAEQRYGDYAGAPLTADAPRVILIGRAA